MSWIGAPQNKYAWPGILSWVAALMGVSNGVGSMTSSPLILDGLKILVLGSVIEFGRRIFQWIVDRFGFRYAVSAEFAKGDIAYEWLVNYLMTENVWHTPRNIYVKAKNSQRKWKFQTGVEDSPVDYVPDFGTVQFFRWKGYWLDVSRLHAGIPYQADMGEFEPPAAPVGYSPDASISLSIYTRDMSVLFAFVEDCRLKYIKNTNSNITIYSFDSLDYLEGFSNWTNVKMKRRRPLDSLLLDEGMVESLLADAREFLQVENWYAQAGIPHRRGYLLYGAPGTGKTTTVYTIAGELGLEIYALSLSANGMDDTLLAQLVSSLPPKAILLIEDIDCAFPSREEKERSDKLPFNMPYHYEKSQVTMSGLLNILDGIGSEEGKLLFATTNHIDRLDPALMRPGRIDRKVEYKLASQSQAHGLFMRFFPQFKLRDSSNCQETEESSSMREAADEFACAIPENELSMAELQGYLLEWKKDPAGAIDGIGAWVENERKGRHEKAVVLRKESAAGKTADEHSMVQDPMAAGVGDTMNLGPDSRLGRPSGVTANDATLDANSDCGTEGCDAKKTTGTQTDGPSAGSGSHIVNGVNDHPFKIWQ